MNTHASYCSGLLSKWDDTNPAVRYFYEAAVPYNKPENCIPFWDMAKFTSTRCFRRRSHASLSRYAGRKLQIQIQEHMQEATTSELHLTRLWAVKQRGYGNEKYT
jgi:hypothetical protein